MFSIAYCKSFKLYLAIKDHMCVLSSNFLWVIVEMWNVSVAIIVFDYGTMGENIHKTNGIIVCVCVCFIYIYIKYISLGKDTNIFIIKTTYQLITSVWN